MFKNNYYDDYDDNSKSKPTIDFCEKILSSDLKLTADEKAETLNALFSALHNMKDQCFAIFKAKDNFDKKNFIKDALEFKFELKSSSSRSSRYDRNLKELPHTIYDCLKKKDNFVVEDSAVEVLQISKHVAPREWSNSKFYVLNVRDQDERYVFKYLIYTNDKIKAYPTFDDDEHFSAIAFKSSKETLEEVMKSGIVKNLFNTHFDFLHSDFTSVLKERKFEHFYPNNKVKKDLS